MVEVRTRRRGRPRSRIDVEPRAALAGDATPTVPATSPAPPPGRRCPGQQRPRRPARRRRAGVRPGTTRSVKISGLCRPRSKSGASRSRSSDRVTMPRRGTSAWPRARRTARRSARRAAARSPRPGRCRPRPGPRRPPPEQAKNTSLSAGPANVPERPSTSMAPSSEVTMLTSSHGRSGWGGRASPATRARDIVDVGRDRATAVASRGRYRWQAGGDAAPSCAHPRCAPATRTRSRTARTGAGGCGPARAGRQRRARLDGRDHRGRGQQRRRALRGADRGRRGAGGRSDVDGGGGVRLGRLPAGRGLADLRIEAAALEEHPTAEFDELAEIWKARGLDAELAAEVARQASPRPTPSPPTPATSSADRGEPPRPLQATVTSALLSRSGPVPRRLSARTQHRALGVRGGHRGGRAGDPRRPGRDAGRR